VCVCMWVCECVGVGVCVCHLLRSDSFQTSAEYLERPLSPE